MTVHFLNLNFERQSYALAFRQLRGRQTHDILANEMNKVFEEFGLTKEQISNIVTDGCSAFTKAFKLFGTEEPFTSRCQTIEEFPLEDVENAVSDDLPFMQSEDGEIFVANILTFGTDELSSVVENSTHEDNDDDHVERLANQQEIDIFDGLLSSDANECPDTVHDSNVTFELPKQRRCVSHSANLLSNDFNKALPKSAKSALMQARNKLHALWVFTHRSSYAKSLCKEYLGCILIVPTETRWNSEFDAVSKGCDKDVKPKINVLIEKIKVEIPKASHLQTLSPMDWAVLDEYITVMKPIATFLDILQRETNGAQGYILPAVTSMLYRINNIAGSNLLLLFKRTALDVIKKRFERYLSVNDFNHDLVLASVSIPKFKTDFIQNDEDKWKAREILLERCKRVAMETIAETEEHGIDTNAIQTKEDFFVLFEPSTSARRTSIDNDIQIQVDRYLNDSRKEETILHEYPNVKRIYFDFNTTLSSSASVERLFSGCKLIFRPQRTKLTASNFERTVLIKTNYLLIKETSE